MTPDRVIRERNREWSGGVVRPGTGHLDLHVPPGQFGGDTPRPECIRRELCRREFGQLPPLPFPPLVQSVSDGIPYQTGLRAASVGGIHRGIGVPGRRRSTGEVVRGADEWPLEPAGGGLAGTGRDTLTCGPAGATAHESTQARSVFSSPCHYPFRPCFSNRCRGYVTSVAGDTHPSSRVYHREGVSGQA